MFVQDQVSGGASFSSEIPAQAEAPCLSVLQQCQWPLVLGKAPPNKARGLYSFGADSSALSHQGLGCDQQDSWNWDPGKRLQPVHDGLEHKTLETYRSWLYYHETTRNQQKVVY